MISHLVATLAARAAFVALEDWISLTFGNERAVLVVKETRNVAVVTSPGPLPHCTRAFLVVGVATLDPGAFAVYPAAGERARNTRTAKHLVRVHEVEWRTLAVCASTRHDLDSGRLGVLFRGHHFFEDSRHRIVRGVVMSRIVFGGWEDVRGLPVRSGEDECGRMCGHERWDVGLSEHPGLEEVRMGACDGASVHTSSVTPSKSTS